MKSVLIVAMLLMSALVSAQEITKNEFFAKVFKNAQAFERVPLGLTISYITIENRDKEKCHVEHKEVVVSQDNSTEYLVYHESVVTQGCDIYKLGDVQKALIWTKKELAKDYYKYFEELGLDIKMINLNGSLAFIQGVEKYTKNNIIYTIDISRSQFSNLTMSVDPGITQRETSLPYFTDVNTIDFEGVEIFDL